MQHKPPLFVEDLMAVIGNRVLSTTAVGTFSHYGQRVSLSAINNGSFVFSPITREIFEIRIFPSNQKPAGLIWITPQYSKAYGDSLHGKMPQEQRPIEVNSLNSMLLLVADIEKDKNAQYDLGLLLDVELELDADLYEILVSRAALVSMTIEQYINYILHSLVVENSAN